jgi:hypothetical protein
MNIYRDTRRKACNFSCKIMVNLVWFKLKSTLLSSFLQQSQVLNFMKICIVILELRACVRTDALVNSRQFSCLDGVYWSPLERGDKVYHVCNSLQRKIRLKCSSVKVHSLSPCTISIRRKCVGMLQLYNTVLVVPCLFAVYFATVIQFADRWLNLYFFKFYIVYFYTSLRYPDSVTVRLNYV